jgi:hypothetical protein
MPPSSAKGTPAIDALPRSDQERAGKARPFDPRELDWLPKANDNDPPYRPWWVIDRD